MRDFLDTLARDAAATVKSGYYKSVQPSKPNKASLREAILTAEKKPVIAELKAASPSRGIIKAKFDPGEVGRAMANGGAVGISVLTEPKHFNGSLSSLTAVRNRVPLPILMKDIVVDASQLDAASAGGANAVLLIQAVFDRGYVSCGLPEMVAKARSKNLEVLLEVHTGEEFSRALQTGADMIGINNRNLATLKVDLNVTKNILSAFKSSKVVVSESGINSPLDVRFLRICGAQAFLIGSSIMTARDIEAKVRGFVNS